MRPTIRAVQESDTTAILELLNPIIARGQSTALSEPLDPAELSEWMRAVLQRGLWLVAERDGGDGLLGFQCVEPYSPHSRSLAHVGEISTCVAMDVHRRGIGGALCEAIFPAARERGYRKLIAAIRADNQPALTFYQEQGFTVIGTAREHVLVGDRYLDEVLTERLLG